jgi:putative phosphoesterase
MSEKIVIISDIHANFEALKLLAPALHEADHILCLGDFVGYYCQVNEVLEYVRDLSATCVRGNHDEYLLTGCPPDAPEAVRFGIDFADRVIEASHREWLATLPLVWGGMIGGRSVLLSHGSPFKPLTDYLYADRIHDVPLSLFDFDLIAFGQTHRPFESQTRRPKLVNPGSVGQSRDRPSIVSAAKLTTDTMKVEFLEYAYDSRKVVALAKGNGAADWIDKHLKA